MAENYLDMSVLNADTQWLVTPNPLTGGVFQNALLLELIHARLPQYPGLRILTHRDVPPNDSGISLGQAALAATV